MNIKKGSLDFWIFNEGLVIGQQQKNFFVWNIIVRTIFSFIFLKQIMLQILKSYTLVGFETMISCYFYFVKYILYSNISHNYLPR
jgi:hypothetical protein